MEGGGLMRSISESLDESLVHALRKFLKSLADMRNWSSLAPCLFGAASGGEGNKLSIGVNPAAAAAAIKGAGGGCASIG